MSEPVNKRAIGVGLFIVIGILLLVGGILIIGNLHSTFQKKLVVSTVFGDVNGLTSGNNIWFSGVKIGTVKRTEFFGKSQVKVLMNINIESKQYIRKDAKVKISSDGLIGNKILVIYGGTAEAPEIEEGDTLSNEKMLTTEDIMNTFQKSNLNILAVTNKLANGEGSIGKLLNNDSIYNNIASTTRSLQAASANAKKLIASLSHFSENLNKKGALVNDLVTDTVMFNSMKTSVLQLRSIADTASVFVNNLKDASANPKSPVGVLLHDEKAGADLKSTIINLESSSKKLDKDLEALQHNFLLRRFFKKEEKKNKK
ncbi:MAG: MCE family protein [Bacteroidia bacterium]|nr:MCE family protein [Bacteroidia bacterium]